MTQEEIQAKRELGERKAMEQLALRKAIEQQKRDDVKLLRDLGFTTMFEGKVSFAARYNEQTGEGEAFFTIMSKKDRFSRPDARRALVQHIEAGVHKFKFHFDSLDCQNASQNQTELRYTLLRRLIRESELNPRNFPRNFAKDYSLLALSWP